jgi:TonB family protein
MLKHALMAQIVFGLLPLLTFAQADAQSASAAPHVRNQLTQNGLCCITANPVSPVYPREARMAGIQGEVKLVLVIGDHNNIVELRAVSGDPLLAEAAMKAIRQWKFLLAGIVGGPPTETEVPITYTFKIEDPPRPAFLELANGKTIRADTVHEYTDGMVYTIGGRTHHISPDSVIRIDPCDLSHTAKPTSDGQACIAAGGPQFVIRAVPLEKTNGK